MDILKHPLCTSSIGAPADMPEPACSALPCTFREDEHGKWTVSFWQPSADELVQLFAGGAIALRVRASGRQHPVVGMGVQPSETAAPAATTAESMDRLREYELFCATYREACSKAYGEGSENMIQFHADVHWNGWPGKMWLARAALYPTPPKHQLHQTAIAAAITGGHGELPELKCLDNVIRYTRLERDIQNPAGHYPNGPYEDFFACDDVLNVLEVAVATERERAARLAIQWGKARQPEHGGNALHAYAQALRNGVDVDERDSDYHWSNAQQSTTAGALTTLLQASGAMRMVRCHDGSGEVFQAYDMAISDKVVAELRANNHSLRAEVDRLKLEQKRARIGEADAFMLEHPGGEYSNLFFQHANAVRYVKDNDLEVEIVPLQRAQPRPLDSECDAAMIQALRRIALNISGDTPAPVIAGDALAGMAAQQGGKGTVML